jgi:CelD/BcsL family acetyltransferase involved in cellulose biosynthesis
MKLFEKLAYVGVVLPSFSSLGQASADSFDAIGHDGSSISMYSCWPAIPRLLSDWSILARRGWEGSVFQTPAWQGAIARPFDRVRRYRLLAVKSPDALRAVLPLQVGAGGTLETPGEMVSDYLDPLVDRTHAETSWRSILELLQLQCAPEKRSVILHNIPDDSTSRSTLNRLAEEFGFHLDDTTSASTARIALPSTWEDYLQTLPSRRRKELKRKINNAVTRAGARLQVFNEVPAIHDELKRVFAFMELAGGSKSLKTRWTYRPIFRRAAEQLAAAGQLRVYSLWLHDRPAAGLICFPSTSGPMLWAGGYDPELRSLSPGIVLFGLAIRDCIESGAKHFDLLRGQDRYKSELGAIDFPLHRLTLRAR